MQKKIAAVLLFALLVVGVFCGISTLDTQSYPAAFPVDGVVDLRAFDFSTAVVDVRNAEGQWYEFYPEQLYTPADFAAGDTVAPIDEIKDFTRYQYGTYRIVMLLPPGLTLSASGRSEQFAQTMYLAGQLAGTVGTVGRTAETTTPRTANYTYTFTVPQNGQVEVIFQYANFNHREGGGTRPMLLGAPENIQSANMKITVNASLLFGCLLAVFLFYFGVWLIHRRRAAYLHFALCCLCVAVRGLFLGDKLVMLFFPQLNWYLAMALEYLLTIGMAALFAAYLANLVPGLLHRPVLWAFYAWSAAYALLVLATKPLVYTRFLVPHQIGVGVMALYVLARLALGLKARQMEEALLFCGAAVFAAGGVLDMALFQYALPFTLVMEFSQAAAMGCVFLNMMALALEMSRTESALSLSRMKERELVAMNAQIEQQLAKLRAEAGAEPPVRSLVRGPLDIDIVSCRAVLYGQNLQLTPKEFALLLALAQHEENTLSTKELYEMVWNQPYAGDSSALWRHMSRLKRKMDHCVLAASETPGGLTPERITLDALRGEGYRLAVEKRECE